MSHSDETSVSATDTPYDQYRSDGWKASNRDYNMKTFKNRTAEVDALINDLGPEAPGMLKKYLADAEKYPRTNTMPAQWQDKKIEQKILDDWQKKFTENRPKEVRVVDPETGGEKGSKLARFDLIPPDVLWALAEHYGKGAEKYDDRNWERSYDWKLSYAAAQRHMNQFWSGEDRDAETGSLHVIAAAWHMFALAAFQLRKIGRDSR